MIETIIIGFLIGTSISAILIVGVLLYQWWMIRHPIEPDPRGFASPVLPQGRR
jgi:hypothetical protein